MPEQKSDEKEQNVDFGFKRVASSLKQTFVNNVFSKVANKYDLMNDVMSFGLHRWWRKHLINNITTINPVILDIASGTGDVILQYLKQAKSAYNQPQAYLTDINHEMLKLARDKAVDNNLIANTHFVLNSGESLAFADASFDYCTIAFGIRNITNIDALIAEVYRVLKPGGQFFCLEFAKIDQPLLNEIYQFYLFNIIPKMGKYIAGDEDSYKYLAESIAKFMTPYELKKHIENFKFRNVSCELLSFGITAIHKATK